MSKRVSKSKKLRRSQLASNLPSVSKTNQPISQTLPQSISLKALEKLDAAKSTSNNN